MQIHDIAVGVLALLGVLTLIWLIQRAVRAGGLTRGATAGRLRLLQSLAIDQRRRVVLVQFDGQDLVLLTGGTTDLVLSTLPSRNTPQAIA